MGARLGGRSLCSGSGTDARSKCRAKLVWFLPCKKEEDNSQGSFAGLTANVPEAGIIMKNRIQKI